MVGPLAIDTYIPTFYAIGHDFGADQTSVRLTLSVFLFGFVFMMLFYGALSDAFGRRPVILWSLAAYTAASFGAALAPGLESFLIFRGLEGLAAGAGSVISRTIIQEQATGADAQRVPVYIMMVFGLSMAIGPIIGEGLHATLGWRSIFWALGLFGALMFLACYSLLPESLAAGPRRRFHLKTLVTDYRRMLKHPQFLWLVLSFGIAFNGFALYARLAANIVATCLHLPEVVFAGLFIPLARGIMIAVTFSTRAVNRISPARLLRIGYFIMVLASMLSIIFNYVTGAIALWALLPLIFYAIGLAVATLANTNMKLDFFPDNRSVASSLQSVVQTLVFAIASGLVAPFLFDSVIKLAGGTLATFGLGLYCLVLGRKNRPTAVLAG
ncbi:MFS transporter, DHA1 family, bicyclomycin/chloramphenicol resistance protein [Collimonas sp. OK607]|nr:MFS transporter, DHA1 family, bicyclomycin/chloramphenicol resistance protein [Collimonas sp. OK607]